MTAARLTVASVLVFGASVGSACGVFDATDSAAPPVVEAGIEADAPVDSSVPPAPDDAAAVDAAEAGPPCLASDQLTESVAPEADGLIGAGAADQPRGDSGICNMAVGRCVMRFAPSGAAITALRAARGISMALQLRRADSQVECNPNCSTATFRQDGTLSVFPLRTDWNELEVTWNNRKTGAGNGWGKPGAFMLVVDHGDLAGQLAVPAQTTSPVVMLDVSRWTTAFLIDAKIGLVTNFKTTADLDAESITNNREFVLVMKDRSPTPATPNEPPKLTVTYCP